MKWFLVFWVFSAVGQPVATRVLMPSLTACRQVMMAQVKPADFNCMAEGPHSTTASPAARVYYTRMPP